MGTFKQEPMIGSSTVKDALQYILGRLKDQRPVTHKVGEVEYAVNADGTLGHAVRELAPQWVKPAVIVSSLSGIVAALKAGVDGVDPAKVYVHVTEPYMVVVASRNADEYGQRQFWIQAKHAPDTSFQFNTYLAPEDFIIKFRASFLYNDEAVRVQQVCSTVSAGESVLVADDGISQEVTIKSGTVTKSSITLPADGIPLIPWRTFRDARPVISKFLLRMKSVKDSLPLIALFEIDAQWKRETVNSVANYLTESLPEFTVIA